MEEERNYEEEAQAMGHVSKEDWKGAPDKWTTPQEFVERNESFVPFLKKAKKELEAEVEQIRSDVQMMAKINKEERETARLAGYAKATAEYEAKLVTLSEKKIEAIENGDTAAFVKIEQQEKKLKAPAAPQQVSQLDLQAGEDPGFTKWKTENPWFEEDEVLNTYIIGRAQKIGWENPKMTDAEIRKQAKSDTKKAFPHKFENPNRDGHNSVEGGGNGPTGGNGKVPTKISEIKDPKDRTAARETFKRIKENFTCEGRDYTETEYMTAYVK